MYLGRIMEVGDSETVFHGPNHPYTEACCPPCRAWTARPAARIRLEGEIPSPANPPSGCVFHTRCHRFIQGICEVTEPPLVEVEPGHQMKCHIPLEELRRLQTKAKVEDIVLTTPPEAIEAAVALDHDGSAAGGPA